jgi:hypothetical protein
LLRGCAQDETIARKNARQVEQVRHASDRYCRSACALIFERERGREAVAELRRIGEHVPARRAGALAVVVHEVRVRSGRGVEVEERLRPAEGEARELNERTVGIGAFAGTGSPTRRPAL